MATSHESHHAQEEARAALFDPKSTWLRLAQGRWVLETLGKELGRVGVDVLAVKGVVTAGWLYEDTSARPISDIDVRIRPRDFRATYLACERLGWVIQRRVWAYRDLVVLVNGFPVDIEGYVGAPGVVDFPVAEMFERATRDPRGFWVPDAHDHAVLLTVNVFKDKLVQAFSWAMDDVERVVAARGFDVGIFVKRLRRARATAIGWIVANWLIETRGSERWVEVRDRLQEHGPPRPRYARMYRAFIERERQFTLGMRVLARISSDDPTMWPGALLSSAAFQLERRWDAHRRSR